MLNLPLGINEFVSEYWQKKPLLIQAALTDFKNPISADELAGLSMEKELESRIVIQNPVQSRQWTLKRGPFSLSDFKKLPKSHWTLLVGAVDRFVPEVSDLLDHFNFIPQWRVDDVMISYAAEQGSVGPHYDNYDVFLYQAQGQRRWLLTTQDCVPSNYLPDLELRIMKDFKVEQEYILEEGDMLYLPPHVGHYGISLTNDCLTYSFGYRSYQDLEVWDSFGDYLASTKRAPLLYQDPVWTKLRMPSQLPKEAWLQAKSLMQAVLDDEALLQDWFGLFATQLDRQAEALLPIPDDSDTLQAFTKKILKSKGLRRNPLCRFAYIKSGTKLSLYVNGSKWQLDETSESFVEMIANNRTLLLKDIKLFLDQRANEFFLYELWKLQWLEFF